MFLLLLKLDCSRQLTSTPQAQLCMLTLRNKCSDIYLLSRSVFGSVPTCLNLHCAAGITVAHVAVSSHREFIYFSAFQAREVAGGFGGVAMQRGSCSAGGCGQVEFHSVTFLPGKVGCFSATLHVCFDPQGFTGPLIMCKKTKKLLLL